MEAADGRKKFAGGDEAQRSGRGFVLPEHGGDEVQRIIMRFDVGGEEVSTLSDGHFARVRARHGVKPGFLEGFAWRSLRQFGGKGGSPMAFTPDRRYLIKQLSADDHASLCAHAPRLVDRLMTGDSLLVPLLLHFARRGRHYVAMRSALPALPPGAAFHRKYDLKGSRDDKLLEEEGEPIPEVHKRCFHVHTCWYGCDVVPFCMAADRKRYMLGKAAAFDARFVLGADDAERLRGSLRGDCDVLSALGLMDYSLIVGVLRLPAARPVPHADGLHQLVVRRGGWTHVYYLGIIDYLQGWTLRKQIAMWLKLPCAPRPLSTVPPHIYAHQFARSLQAKFAPEEREGDGALGMDASAILMRA